MDIFKILHRTKRNATLQFPSTTIARFQLGFSCATIALPKAIFLVMCDPPINEL
jgi:hypothetical protein